MKEGNEMTKKDFNKFRFEGLDPKQKSNKYMTMKRVSDDNNKIVVRVGESHLQPTKYGYALVLDRKHVVFLKPWQVDENYFANEVMLNREYFNVKEWGDWEDFSEEPQNLEFESWLKVAKEQQEAGTEVKWRV